MALDDLKTVPELRDRLCVLEEVMLVLGIDTEEAKKVYGMMVDTTDKIEAQLRIDYAMDTIIT